MTPTELPRKITVNDTVFWTESLPDYPASDSWEVTYHFTNPDAHFEATHTPNGEDHDLDIDTTELEAGIYDYAKKVTDGANIETLERGTIEVLPDLSADTDGVDRRSYAETALANIEAVLKGKATSDQTSYSLNGRALSRYSPEELNAWRAQLRVEVRDERRQARRLAGGKSHNNVHVRFPSGSV